MIRVASYNIRRGFGTDWRRRVERNLDVLREVDADIVAVQEADENFGALFADLGPEAIAAETPYAPVSFGTAAHAGGWRGNMVLLRRDVDLIEARPLDLPSQLEQRGAAVVDVRHGGETLRIVAMHLGLSGAWRKRQSRALLDRLKALELPLPTVMMGDLNEWNTETGCLAHFAEEHHVAMPGRSFHSRWRLFAYDRIITSPDLAVAETGVHDSALARVASDHLPVWATIRYDRAQSDKRVEVDREGREGSDGPSAAYDPPRR